MRELLTDARKIPNLLAVMIDPVVMAVSGDSLKNAETRRGLQPLVDLASETEAALMGITHFTKGTDGQNPIERITGSLAFGALARVALGAAKGESEDAPRRLVRIASNIGPSGGGFEYLLYQDEVPGYGFTAQRALWGAPLNGSAKDLLNGAKETALEEAKDFLLDALKVGPVAQKELKDAAEANGHSWRTIERARQKLLRDRIKASQKPGPGWFWHLIAFDQILNEPLSHLVKGQTAKSAPPLAV